MFKQTSPRYIKPYATATHTILSKGEFDCRLSNAHTLICTGDGQEGRWARNQSATVKRVERVERVEQVRHGGGGGLRKDRVFC